MKLAVEPPLPPGMRLVTLAERPDLTTPMARHNGAVWPTFMLQDPVADRLWHHLDEEFAAFQLLLLDDADAIVAAGNSAPLAWNGTVDDLPDGWDDQFERTVARLRPGSRRTRSAPSRSWSRRAGRGAASVP